jgi:hypothetical protein
MAGYSNRTLTEKLGIKPGYICRSHQAPQGYAKLLGKLPHGARFESKSRAGLDFIHAFFENAAELRKEFPALHRMLKKDGTFWVSWRKGKVSNLTEDVVREVALASGLVDVKVCAVDNVWSGLKLVVRREDR